MQQLKVAGTEGTGCWYKSSKLNYLSRSIFEKALYRFIYLNYVIKGTTSLTEVRQKVYFCRNKLFWFVSHEHTHVSLLKQWLIIFALYPFFAQFMPQKKYGTNSLSIFCNVDIFLFQIFQMSQFINGKGIIHYRHSKKREIENKYPL